MTRIIGYMVRILPLRNLCRYQSRKGNNIYVITDDSDDADDLDILGSSDSERDGLLPSWLRTGGQSLWRGTSERGGGVSVCSGCAEQ
jgi:hypothetical protein